MPKKILIVDDESRTLLLMERTLRDLEDGFPDLEIVTATNGEEALASIKADKPTLIFLDVMMPIVDGFTVCETVKNELDMQDVYIVMLTAAGQEADKQRCEEVGADVYLPKPFDPDQVRAIANEVLGLTD